MRRRDAVIKRLDRIAVSIESGAALPARRDSSSVPANGSTGEANP